MYPAEHKTPCIRPWKTLHAGSRAEHRSWDGLLEERTVAVHSSSKVQMLCSRKKGTNSPLQWPEKYRVTDGQQRVKTGLEKDFWWSQNTKSQLEDNARLKQMKWMGRQGMNFASWQSPVLTAHARAKTGISLTREVILQQEWQFFWSEGKSIQRKKSSKILFLKKKENHFSSNKKALKHFQLQVQTEWFVLQKQRSASVHCKRDTLYFQGIATGVMIGWHTNQIQQELLKTYIFHFHG